MSKYVKKGQLIAVDGSLYTRKYQDRDGNNRTAYEVNVNNFYFAESKKSANVGIRPDLINDVADKLSNAGFDNSIDDMDDLPF